MMILVPLFVCVLGALVYALSGNAKIGQLALYAYAAGLLVTLARVADNAISLLK